MTAKLLSSVRLLCNHKLFIKGTGKLPMVNFAF